MEEKNTFNIRDQGVFLNGFETSLEKILHSLSSPNLDEREPCMDDFWLVSGEALGELMICMGSKERCSVYYQPWNSAGFWACDHNHVGKPIFARDPGAVEKLIPARYMLRHQDAIPIITEYWKTGAISDISGWSPYDHDELDFPRDTPSGHPKGATYASRQAMVRVEKKMAKKFEAQFTGCLGLVCNAFLRIVSGKSEYARLCEHAYMGDSNPAVVVSLDPLLVAAYSDELDTVALLRYDVDIVAALGLTLGARLVTSNTYFDTHLRSFAQDVEPGENWLKRYVNFYPVILDFVTSDKQRIAELQSMIPEDMWQRAAEQGRRKLTESPWKTRHGSPFRSMEKY